MSVRTRIDDAKVLWNAGRKEGAFTFILLSFAATARKRYPQYIKGQPKNDSKDHRPLHGEPAKDNIAFKSFVLDEMEKITGGPKYNVAFPFNGQSSVPLEEILYTHLRNAFIHECAIPTTISFTEPQIIEGKSHSVIQFNDPLGFPEYWIWNMARVVAQAPENRPLFNDYEINQKP